MSKNRKIICLIILLIIVSYGIAARWSVLKGTIVTNPIMGDASEYFIYAKNLSQFSTYSLQLVTKNNNLKKDSKRPPGFPFFASFFYQGENIDSIKPVLLVQTILQCLAFVALSISIWYLFGEIISVFISFLIWTHPAFMSINTYYLTESLFLTSLILIMLLFTKIVTSKKNKSAMLYIIFLGIFTGISAFIRSTIDYYLFFVLAIIFVQDRKFFKKIWYALIIFVLITMTWKIRNFFAIGSFSDPSLMIGSLFHGSYPNFMYNDIPQSFAFAYRFDPLRSEYYKGVGTTLHLIWNRVLEKPFQYLSWYALGKQFFLWQWNIIAGMGDIFIYPVTISPFHYQKDLQLLHTLHKFSNSIMMIVGVLYSYYVIVSGLLRRKSVDVVFIISSLVVYASLVHVIVAPYPRYSIPFKAFVIIMFTLAIKSFIILIKKRALK